MTCSKCTQLPELEHYDCFVYLSVTADHLMSQVKLSLATLKYHFVSHDGYLIITTPNFELLLSELDEGEFFDRIELHEVYLLPIKPNVPMDFALFTKTKSLTYWITLLHSKGLIYALSNGQFKTVFQPIVRASDHSIYGYEALNRGILPDGRIMAPSGMFKQAKALDLLFNLDRQCREASILSASERHIDSHLFINFIPTAIYNPEECLKSTDEAVSREGLNPHKIVFEVVETEKIDDYGHLKRILAYYKSKGYKTALDDVGSGYSTLDAYQALGTEIVKIDRTIIRHIQSNPGNQVFLRRLLQFKKDYGSIILAEGVETLEEAEYLKREGVDLFQGYYFGKPE